MLLDPFNVFLLAFFAGEFGDFLFGYRLTVIAFHSFFFSFVGFFGYGVALQVADIIRDLTYAVAKIRVERVRAVIAVDHHLCKPSFGRRFHIVGHFIVCSKIYLQALYLCQIIYHTESPAYRSERRDIFFNSAKPVKRHINFKNPVIILRRYLL